MPCDKQHKWKEEAREKDSVDFSCPCGAAANVEIKKDGSTVIVVMQPRLKEASEEGLKQVITDQVGHPLVLCDSCRQRAVKNGGTWNCYTCCSCHGTLSHPEPLCFKDVNSGAEFKLRGGIVQQLPVAPFEHGDLDAALDQLPF
jgi:hypothetical protein